MYCLFTREIYSKIVDNPSPLSNTPNNNNNINSNNNNNININNSNSNSNSNTPIVPFHISPQIQAMTSPQLYEICEQYLWTLHKNLSSQEYLSGGKPTIIDLLAVHLVGFSKSFKGKILDSEYSHIARYVTCHLYPSSSLFSFLIMY